MLMIFVQQRIISKVCVSHWFSHKSHRISNLADDLFPRHPRVNDLILSWPCASWVSLETLEESGDDLNPVLMSGFGRSGWVGVDGGLTGFM